MEVVDSVEPVATSPEVISDDEANENEVSNNKKRVKAKTHQFTREMALMSIKGGQLLMKNP